MNTQSNRFLLQIATLLVAQAVGAQEHPVATTDRTFELTVAGDGVDAFRDCATFRADGALLLQAGKGLVIDWMPEASTSPRGFRAVTDGSRLAANPVGLALHGAFDDGGRITGEAINDRGSTFEFSGRLNRYCELSSLYYAGDSPYAAPSAPVIFEPSEASVAGRVYGMRLYGADVPDDCFNFAINGTLVRNGGEQLTWRMQALNAREGTFQAVGAPGRGSAGLALYGELTSWEELRVYGIESNASGAREIVGSGREVAACIAD